MISPSQRQELLAEMYALEDKALQLIRRINLALVPEDVREEMRYVSAKKEVFFNGLEDLIHHDPAAAGNADEAELRRIRRESDELFLARAEIDRRLRDSRRRAVETEEQVRIDRAHRHAAEIQVEIARLDPQAGA